MKTKKRIITITVILVAAMLVATGVVLFGNGSDNNESKQQGIPNTAIRIDEVTKGDIVNSISGKGTVQTNEITSIKTPFKCTVDKLQVREGTQVNAGDVLYTMNSGKLEKVLDEAKTELSKALDEVSNTPKTYHTISVRAPVAGKVQNVNIKKKQKMDDVNALDKEAVEIVDGNGETAILILPDNGEITAINVRTGKTVKKGAVLFKVKVASDAFGAALNTAEEARAEVAKLEQYLSDPTFYAKADGIVKEVKSEVIGTENEKGTLVMSIQPESGYMLNIDITQQELNSISVGQTAEISFETGEPISGTVAHISYIADDEGMFQIGIALDDATTENQIYPGVKATASIVLEKRENVVRVPVEAIKQDEKGDYVMVYTGDKDVITDEDAADIPMEKRYIEYGLTSSLYAEVYSGIEEGERVILVKTSGSNDSNDIQVIKYG